MNRFLIVSMVFFGPSVIHADDVKKGKQWLVFPGGEGPGAGKHVVLIAGDH